MENVPQFRKALRKFRNDLSVGKILELGLSATGKDRISTWSKVLAAYMPGTCFIYDSRVALALSYISLKLNAPCFWQIPQDQNDKINNSCFRDAFFNGQTVKYVAENNRGNNMVCVSDREKHWKKDGLDIPTCYSRYLLLLKALAREQEIRREYDNLVAEARDTDNDIGEAYEIAFAFIQDENQRKDKAIMAHLEKVLFMKKDDLLAPRRSGRTRNPKLTE